MPARNPTEYLRNWHKQNPHYSRNRMRRQRGWRPDRCRVYILGVLVKPYWMPIPEVTREQANEEFLRLTADMERR
jgi:hypothetical protein